MSTYTKIYIQIVFAVHKRRAHIDPNWEEDLYKYLSGIINNKGQKSLAINGMPDHIHIFIGMRPTCCLSDLVREIKKSSNDLINSNFVSEQSFKWQDGFGAFSYSHSAIDHVINYIMNQKQHHAKKTFKDEYLELLRNFEVDYQDEYVMKWFDDE